MTIHLYKCFPYLLSIVDQMDEHSNNLPISGHNWALGDDMNPSHRTHCVPSSILCALIYVIKEKRPVRIAIFNLSEGVDHAQAQVMDENGEWQWLSERWNGECMEAFILGHQNHPDAEEPYRYVRLLDFMQEQIQVLGLENLV